MTDDELAEAIEAIRLAGAEVNDIEAKAAESSLPKSLRHSLSAFANTSGGGLIILGLDEGAGFAATGVADAKKLAADLASMCATDLEPAIRAVINVHDFEGVRLVVAEVPELEASQKPCFYRGAGMNNGSYVRVNDSDFRLSAHEVQMMVASRGQPRDDEQPVLEARVEDLEPSVLRAFLTRVRESRPAFLDISDDDALRRLRVVTQIDGGELVPTLGGLLALGTYPQQYFPQLNLTFVHYPTSDGADPATGERFIDSRAFDGSIPVIVRDALDAVRRNMMRRSVVQSAGRQDAWEYPEPALREVIVNALVHRDLSAHSRGAQVQLEMYPDRLVVRNPGGLFGPVTLARLGEEGVSSARNASLLRILEDVPIPGEDGSVCENRGSGIKVMVQSLRGARMSAPEFTDRISSFQVAFPNHTLMGEDTVRWLRALGQEGLTESQCIGLALLRDGHVLTNSSYRSATLVDSRVATNELQDLVGRELVEQTGIRRWASYSLAAGVSAVRGGRTAPADRREQILRELGSGTLSRAELVDRTGLKPQTVRRWLLRLRQEGKIEIVGGAPQSNRARYRALQPYVQEGAQLALEFPDDDSS